MAATRTRQLAWALKDTAFTLGSYSADPLCQSKVRALLTGLVKGVSGWRKQAS